MIVNQFSQIWYWINFTVLKVLGYNNTSSHCGVKDCYKGPLLLRNKICIGKVYYLKMLATLMLDDVTRLNLTMNTAGRLVLWHLCHLTDTQLDKQTFILTLLVSVFTAWKLILIHSSAFCVFNLPRNYESIKLWFDY